MITLNGIKEIFENRNIDVFNILDIGDVFKTGFLLNGTEELLKLIQSADIKRVFIYEHYEDAEDYYITEEIIQREARYESEEFLEYILPQVDEYNSQISKLDFSYPSCIVVVCFLEGKAFFTIHNNSRTLNEKDLTEPQTKFKNICVFNEIHRQEIKQETTDKINLLREELRQQILNDNEFKLCTNQELRRNYAYKLFKKMAKKYLPLKKVMYRENLGILSLEGRDFIELLWREIKNNEKR